MCGFVRLFGSGIVGEEVVELRIVRLCVSDVVTEFLFFLPFGLLGLKGIAKIATGCS
jgi:hypothetical protein